MARQLTRRRRRTPAPAARYTARRRVNPSVPAWGWGLAAVLALVTLGTAAVAVAKTHSNPPIEKARLQALADEWAPKFGIQPVSMMAIGKIESAWKPDTVNYSISSIPRGGAWGPWQMTQLTAGDMAKRLQQNSDPEIAAVGARWNGDGRQLLTDLELAAAMTAQFMGDLAKEFGGSFTNVAAAYHQGASKVRKMLAAGEAIPDELPPKGKKYVTLALAARSGLA